MEKINYCVERTALGFIVIAESQRGVCYLHLSDSPEELEEDLFYQFPHAKKGQCRYLAQVKKWIIKPFDHAIPLDIRGTTFRKKVWQEVMNIPIGKSISYSELAEKVGAPKAFRAAASACTHTPIAFLIPCHRVHAKDGSFRCGPIGEKLFKKEHL